MGRLQLIGIISKGGFSLAILVALCVSCTSKNNNKYNYKICRRIRWAILMM